MFGVIKRLKNGGVTVIVYEPTLPDGSEYYDCKIVEDLTKFIASSDVIMANRFNKELIIIKDKIYTCDLFAKDQGAICSKG